MRSDSVFNILSPFREPDHTIGLNHYTFDKLIILFQAIGKLTEMILDLSTL